MIKITKTGIIKDTKQENYSSPRFKDMVKFFATEWLGEAFTDCYLGVADQLWQQHDAKNKLAPQELAEYKNKVKQKTNDWLLEEYSIGIVVQKLFIPLLLIIDEFNKKGSITHKDLNKVFRKYEERYLNKLKPTDEPVRFKVNPE
ncbi:hypothetical protein FACS1894166_12780 [Bacilli bacterium]|nr:hypothetical protein FACS1894166_12780 [Bacilli bacterium]